MIILSTTRTLLPILLLLLSTVLADLPLRRYRIQLDAPASSRWDQVVDDHLQHVPLMLKEARNFDERVQKTAWKIAENITDHFPVEYAEELEGIASRSGIPLGDIVAYNIEYDIMTYNREHKQFLGCTSIVACDEQGRIMHGRNMDYHMGGLLRQTTFNVDFYRGEKLLYTGTSYVLYVGLATGQRPGGFSVSLNTRYAGTYAENVEMAKITNFRTPTIFLVRKTLEEESTFSGAVEKLSNTPLIAPAYFIVGGVGPFEGVVISRNRWNATNVQRLNEDNWFIAQSNVDHWTDDVDMRSIVASRLLSEMGRRRLNAHSLFTVLSTSPVRNNATIHSGVMSAANPAIIYETTMVTELIRESTQPIPSSSNDLCFFGMVLLMSILKFLGTGFNSQ